MWAGSQPVVAGSAGKTVARHRRNHDIERIGCISAVRGGIGQRIDDLHLFGDRAGPSVRDDQRQRIFVFRTDVNEMNVQPIDLGDELRQGVQFCLDLAPVILCRPIARQRLHRRELYALGCIRDRFSFRPLCCVDAPAQFGKFRFRNIHLKRTNGGVVRCLLAASFCNSGLGHRVLPSMVYFELSVNTYDCMQCASPASRVMRLTRKCLRAFGV